MKTGFARFVFLLVALVAFSMLFPQLALAQGTTPPPLPTLDQLLRMSLSAVGALVFVALFSYYWGYAVSAIAARLPIALPSWVWDLVVVVPIAGVAAAWNAFAQFINVAFPGALDKTVGDVLLWLANFLLSAFWSRRGGIANVADVGKLSHSTARDLASATAAVQRGAAGVLLMR